MLARGSMALGIAVQTLTEEAERSDHPSRNPILARATLIVGPPRIGKTCWAIRRAWRTSLDLSPCSIFYFHANDDPVSLHVLSSKLGRRENCIIIIDDIHIDKSKWAYRVRSFLDERPDTVWVVGIARDESVAASLGIDEEQIALAPFPMDEVIDLFLKRLAFATPDLRAVAALEAGLDPALGREMERRGRSAPSPEEFVRKIRRWNEEGVEEALRQAKDKLGEQGYQTYKGLLPFGSTAFPVERKFLTNMAGTDSDAIGEMLRKQYCRIVQDETKLQSTEHPFQVRRTLRYWDKHGTEEQTARGFAVPYLTPDADKPLKRKPITISKAALGRYVQSSENPVEILGALSQHAEWAGVLEPMRDAAQHLYETVSDEKLREEARKIAFKFSRTAYPGDEPADHQKFEKTLREVNLDWCETARRLAEQSGEDFHAGNRLDLILYEEAYIHYLFGEYDVATALFRNSVDAGLKAIARALTSSERTEKTVERARFALANIWISGLLEKHSILRGHLQDAVTGKYQVDVEWIIETVAGIQAIYHELTAAWMEGPEGLATGKPYLNAAEKSLRPQHQFPDEGLSIDLRHERYQNFLKRHRFNAYMDSFVTPSWPWLFLSRRVSIRNPIDPTIDWREMVPLGDRDCRIEYSYQLGQLLFRAARGEEQKDLNPLRIAAMLRAAGSFEHLGDALLLAWKTTESAEKRGIAWFLANRVPDVGGNKLPKLALKALSAAGNA